jgi:hypothetical protein
MKYFKIILINLFVLILLILFFEIAYRSKKFFVSCLNTGCNFHYFLKPADFLSPYENMYIFNDKLGYSYKPNFSARIIKWKDAQISIDRLGFRKNGEVDSRSTQKILAVGDSFTFGDGVSDEKTWPACLQRKLKIGVINAGVGGYGAAQSLRRAEIENLRDVYHNIIFSILVDSDFDRDRMDYRNCLPKPSVIEDNSFLLWSNVSDPQKEGTVFNPGLKYPIIYKNFFSIRSLFKKLDINECKLNSIHPRAAEKKKIIKWTLSKFSKLNAKNKILLLQYHSEILKPHTDKAKQKIDEERAFIINEAKKLSIKIVDTYEILRNADLNKTWFGHFGHHTSHGNELVCSSLYKVLAQKFK